MQVLLLTELPALFQAQNLLLAQAAAADVKPDDTLLNVRHDAPSPGQHRHVLSSCEWLEVKSFAPNALLQRWPMRFGLRGLADDPRVAGVASSDATSVGVRLFACIRTDKHSKC
jgi:hypothetical protein